VAAEREDMVKEPISRLAPHALENELRVVGAAYIYHCLVQCLHRVQVLLVGDLDAVEVQDELPAGFPLVEALIEAIGCQPLLHVIYVSEFVFLVHLIINT